MDKVTVTRDGAGNFFAEVGRSVKGLFDSFHREVSVTSVDYFEESNLRVSSKVDVLCAVGNELH